MSTQLHYLIIPRKQVKQLLKNNENNPEALQHRELIK